MLMRPDAGPGFQRSIHFFVPFYMRRDLVRIRAYLGNPAVGRQRDAAAFHTRPAEVGDCRPALVGVVQGIGEDVDLLLYDT